MGHVETSAPERVVPAQRTPTYDEGVLRRAAALGDLDAWEGLVAAHAPALWRAAVASGRTAEEAMGLCDLAWRRAAEGLGDASQVPLRVQLLRVLDAGSPSAPALSADAG